MEEAIQKALNKGVEMHLLGEYEFANQLYSSVLKIQPNHADANHNIGLLKLDMGHDLEALRHLQTALQADTSVVQFWCSYIKALIKIKKLDEAVRILNLTKDKGLEGEELLELDRLLNVSIEKSLVTYVNQDQSKQDGSNILDTNKLDKALRLAKNYASEGALEEARRVYNEILAKFPKNKKARQGLAHFQNPSPKTLNQLTDLYNKGKLRELIKKLEVLIKTYPDAFVVWSMMGTASAQIGELEQALHAFRKVILLKPDYAEGHYNLGNALQLIGEKEEAIKEYYKVISLNSNYAQAYNNLGLIIQNQGKLEEAVEIYNKALAVKPNYAEVHNNKGVVFQNQGKFEEALDCYNKALAIKPNFAEAFNNLGKTLKDQSKLEEAREAYRKALSLRPNYAEAYYNMGAVLQDLDLRDRDKQGGTIEAYRHALAIKPDFVEAHQNMGIALREQGRLDEAIEAYKKAISLKPDLAEAHENLSFALLNSGKLKEGLEEYEWRWKTVKNASEKRQFAKPLWDGQKSLKGKKILVWSEQGVGDTINWSSCLSHVSLQAEHCILECPKKTVPLLKRSFPDVEVKFTDRQLESQRDDFDFHLPMGSLYRHFIQHILKHPKTDAFLIPDPDRVSFWRERLQSLGNGPFVGVSWKSSNMSPGRLPNYAPISEWSPIFSLTDITFINLQYTDFAEDLKKIKNEFGVKVHNFEDLDHYNDIDDVAALCAALDMVVSTKITVPLISAGVGTSTKLANWRQSPWNNKLLNPVGPLVDILERNTWESWDFVFSSIAHDIIKFKNKVNA
ncbi:tetratricopeptide repeat protein [Paracoccaceae bacterium]|nr:tetratricopeptide repeat protein [Paracoccaceae bacterium]